MLSSKLALFKSSVLALRISWAGSVPAGGSGGAEGLDGGATEGAGVSSRVRFHRPVPGMLTLLYVPCGPMFKLNGAAPSVALRPRRVRLSLTPGRTLNDFRNASSFPSSRPTSLSRSGIQNNIIHRNCEGDNRRLPITWHHGASRNDGTLSKTPKRSRC